MISNIPEIGIYKEMNILVITPSFSNGNDIYIRNKFVKDQVEELKKYFKEVIVIAPVLNTFGLSKKDISCKNYSYDNVRVYYPRCVYIPIFWTKNILLDNRFRIIKKTIEEHGIYFDIIHSHFTWPSGYIGVKLKELYNKPVVITIHENGEWFDREVRLNLSLLVQSWSKADALIRVNKKDIPTLKRYNNNVHNIPNGFSPSLCPIDSNQSRMRLGISPDKKVIFSLGNLFKRKGFNYLITAMKYISDERDDVVCLIGGSGPEKRKLERQINRLGLNNNVKLIGSISNEMLPLWMNACDLFVLPSLSESFGVVQIEAMACGKPVVATINGGSEEIINSNCGLLVEAGNVKELSKSILTALEMDWDSTAIRHLSEQFSMDKIILRTINNVYLNNIIK